MRQRRLQLRHRAVEQVGRVRIEEGDERLDQARIIRHVRELHEVGIILRVPHDRQLVPLRKPAVEGGRHGQRLAVALERAALAEQRRDDMVDDLLVERVAGNPDACMREGLRAHFARTRIKPQDREVACPPAEIRHEDRRGLAEPLRIEERRCHRLVDMVDRLEAEPLQRRLISLLRQLLVRLRAGKLYGPPHHHLRGPVRPAPFRQAPKIRRQKILEIPVLVMDHGRGKQRARRERLERLDEPAVPAEFQELVDRPGPDLHHGARSAPVLILPEAQHRAARLERRIVMPETHRLRGAIRLGEHRHAVGGAEVEAERGGSLCHRGLLCCGKGQAN